MVEIAHTTDDLQMAFNAHKEVAQYVTAKLKAVEMQVDMTGDVRFGWHDPHTIQSETATGSHTPEPE